jgi:ketosteroid isomerase-like protein
MKREVTLMQRRVVALAAVPVLLGACAPGSSLRLATEYEMVAVHSMVEDLDRIAAAEDLDAFMEYIDEDCVALAPYEPAIVGADAIREWYENFYDTYRIEIQHQPGETFAIGDVFIHRGVATSIVTPEDGGAGTGFENKYLMILRRDEGGPFRIWRVAYNSNTPPVLGG